MTVDDADDDPPLLSGSPAAERAVHVATSNGMPEASVGLYARWWQLETWLRELIYVELRSIYGVDWRDSVKTAFSRQEQDAVYTHMSAADVENPLAYLDYSQLLQIIDANWSRFEYALLTKVVWDGRQEELKRIRHRIGHVRQPHDDDLARLEQTLRDLEQGAFIAYASYNTRRDSFEDHSGSIAEGWIHGNHPTAKRLIEHADWQYEIGFRMTASRRPWAKWPDNLAGAEGILWHCDFYLRKSYIDARRFWHDSQLLPAKRYLVHMLATDPYQIGFTFAAVDDPDVIADTIGDTFDALLSAERRGLLEAEEWAAWARRARTVDYRLKHASGWNIVDNQTLPISNFGSGGGVEAVPRW